MCSVFIYVSHSVQYFWNHECCIDFLNLRAHRLSADHHAQESTECKPPVVHNKKTYVAYNLLLPPLSHRPPKGGRSDECGSGLPFSLKNLHARIAKTCWFCHRSRKESNRRRLYRLALVSAIHINYAHQSGCDRFLCVLVDKAHFLANMSSAQLVYWSPPFEEVVGKMLMFWHLDYIKQCLTRCFSRPVHTQS